MRSIEYLVLSYPNKTCKEILAIQAKEKLQDQKVFEKHNKKVLAFIKDINTNGGFYRGRFGLDQHYYYNVRNLVMDELGKVHMNVDSIVLFCNNDGHKNTVTRAGEMHFERKTKEYAELSTYDLDSRERVTAKEWNEINAYIDAMSKLFWK